MEHLDVDMEWECTDDEKFAYLSLEQCDGPVSKKQRKDKFDYNILWEDVT